MRVGITSINSTFDVTIIYSDSTFTVITVILVLQQHYSIHLYHDDILLHLALSNLAIIIIHRIAAIFCYVESAFNHDELFLETRDRSLVSVDRPRHTRVSIWVRCFDDGKPKFRHNRNSPSADR